MERIIESDTRDCSDCDGTGYGGFDRSMEFCTCTAGSLAMAFWSLHAAAYSRWLKAYQASIYGPDEEAA
jgi:hypothetical protein